MAKKISKFFEKFLARDTLFKDKQVLQMNYIPDDITHRDEQVDQIAEILAPSLKKQKPSNVFIYGKVGSGKTLVVKYITNQLLDTANKLNVPLKILYINCKLKRVADTEYRLMAQLIRDFGKDIPTTGLPTDEIYKTFFNIVDSKKQLLILILDEIDQLVKKCGDGILYNLTRINEELKNSQLSLVGISNDLVFVDNLDPRVKSSLSEEEIIFPPYNALQIQDILSQRVIKAFKEDVVHQGVIAKCAAYAAREHGDARRALELTRVAGELAERESSPSVNIEHLDKAEQKIEKDRIVDTIKTQPLQCQLVLYAIIKMYLKKKDVILTGEVYDIYKEHCSRSGLRPLTQRRISDIIAELDMFGILNVKVISKGRYGRTREISLAIQPSMLPKIISLLEQSLNVS
ncbi:MAG: ORC1-type DNA replication protein [Candidatus Woesearchaeota archaeon]|jgi:cell division control protein 6|nr:ORC1-type DNA replication protein [Candidatus Woesearchaeota archaeon]|tara:strand:- start:6977 stop:8185 length:1209 start_codon:yes stop_codon:yes gene_type:complete